MSNLEVVELLKFLGLILLTIYLSFCIFLILLLITGKMKFEYTDNKKHSKFEFMISIIAFIIFWPFYLIKSEISKGDE